MFANEESFVIRNGVTTLVQSATFPNGQSTTTEYCLDVATNYRYSLDLKDEYGDAWGTGSSLTIEGLYGNVIFKGGVLVDGFSSYPTYSLVVNYPIAKETDWKFSSSMESNWNQNSFADSTWSTFNAGTVTQSVSGTQYYRKTFTSFDGLAAYEARFNYKYGIIAYVNGAEVYRDNMAAGEVTSTTASEGSYSVAEFRGFIRPAANLDSSSTNVLAVEVHFSAGHEEVPIFDAWLALYDPTSTSTMTVAATPCYIIPYPTTFTSSDPSGTTSSFYDWERTTKYTYSGIGTSPLTLTFQFTNLAVLINGVEMYAPYNNGNLPNQFSISGANQVLSTSFTEVFSINDMTFSSYTYNYATYNFATDIYKAHRFTATGMSNTAGDMDIYELHFAVCNFAPPSSMTFEPATINVIQNVDSVNTAPTVDGFVGCTSNPALPSGLTLDPDTCTITGIVTTAGTQSYTISSTTGAGYTAVIIITATPCTGNVIEIKRVYGYADAVKERYKLIDLNDQSVPVEVGFSSGQASSSTVITRHCLSGTRYELELGQNGVSYWMHNSFVYIFGVIGDGLEPILSARMDDVLGLPASVYFNVDYSIKPYEQWSYKTEFVANWYDNNVSGWQTGSRGAFTAASSGRIQIFKKSFTVSNLQNVSGFALNIRYQYGCIVYLNNHEVFRNRVTGDLSASSTATDSYTDVKYRMITLPVKTLATTSTSAVDYIVSGTNNIAIALVAMQDTQTAIEFDCALRLFGDVISDRTMSFTPATNNFVNVVYAFKNINIFRTESYTSSGNYIDVTFDDDRREWISSFSITNNVNTLDHGAQSVTLKARNSNTEEWTTLVTYDSLKWWAAGQTKTIYVANNKPYNTYRFDNIGAASQGTSYLVYINRLALYANNMQSAPTTLSYANTNAFLDIEMAELYPSSSQFSNFSISPALPTGLFIDPSSGVIMGTPTELKAAQDYTVSATSMTGQSVTATFTFGVIVCTGENGGLVTITMRSDSYPTEASYQVFTGRDTTGTPLKSGGLLDMASLYYLDMCIPKDIYTFVAKDSYGDGWMAPAGYKMSIDVGELNFEMNQVAGSVTTTVFSSFIPFQVAYTDWKVFTSLQVGSGWNTVSFDDSTWETKKASEVTSSEGVTAYFRKTFDIPNLEDYQVMNVRVKYLGGLAAYFNGNLVARFNLADSFNEETEAPTMNTGDLFKKFHIILAVSGAVQGTNVIAFEHHRVKDTSSTDSVVFDASAVFGVEECSSVIDTYSSFNYTDGMTASPSDLFQMTPVYTVVFPSTEGTFVEWAVDNEVGSAFNSFVNYVTSNNPTYGFSLYGRFNAEEGYTSMFAETNFALAMQVPNVADVPLGIARFKQFRVEVDAPGNGLMVFNAFVFRYCKPSGAGICPGVGNYPAVGEGQISPSTCGEGFRGYSFRNCTNGELSEVDNSHCIYKVPVNLAYSSDRLTLVKDVFFKSEAPTYSNIIVEFYLDTNVNLPDGLSLDPTTGVISGTPSSEFPFTAFSIYGKNPQGAAVTTISIAVRSGECAAEGNFQKTTVGETAVYECSRQGSYIGTLQRQCTLGESDGVWEKTSGMCIPVVGIVIVIVFVIIVIVVVVFLIIRKTKSKKVGSRNKNANKSKVMKATEKPKAGTKPVTKDVKV